MLRKKNLPTFISPSLATLSELARHPTVPIGCMRSNSTAIVSRPGSIEKSKVIYLQGPRLDQKVSNHCIRSVEAAGKNALIDGEVVAEGPRWCFKLFHCCSRT